MYAVGDAIMLKDYLHRTDVAIPLAGPANEQGRIAADNIAGLGRTYKGSLGTSILKIFSMAAASTGNNERNLQRMGKGIQLCCTSIQIRMQAIILERHSLR